MSWKSDLPPDDVAAIETEMQGEAVRWAGKPDAGRAFRYGFAIYAMGIPWSALTFTLFGFLVAAVFSGNPPNRTVHNFEYLAMGAAIIFTGAFAAAGVAMLATPFYIWRKARGTVYAITDKRVITVVTGRTMEVSAISGDKILKLERREKRDGSGTLKIVTGYGKDSDGDRIEETTELFGVRDVRAAERAVEEIRGNRRA